MTLTNTLYHLSWDELHRDTRALAHRLIHQPWRGVIGIARGGLVPAAILARELDVRLVDSICIASYDHDRQGEPKILKSVEGDGAGFLLVDDLVDTGTTARIARELLPKAVFVAIYAKPKGKSLADHFQREFTQETWIHFPWDVDLRYAEPLVSRPT
ncbi:MAG: xanthine phosphoribosyltransferase [Spongiibacteraceae bacterium]